MDTMSIAMLWLFRLVCLSTGWAGLITGDLVIMTAAMNGFILDAVWERRLF
jgi:hypothetical protein